MPDCDLELLIVSLAETLDARKEYQHSLGCVYPAGLPNLTQEKYENKLAALKKRLSEFLGV